MNTVPPAHAISSDPTSSDPTSSDPYCLPPWLQTTQALRARKQALWAAPSAELYGDLRFAADVSIWFQCVLRGDVNYIAIGAGSNIQDGSILHVTNAQPCIVGAGVTVGHRALLHACNIADGVLIGMGAIVLSGAEIGRGAVIAAGALVKEKAIVPPYTLMAGVPAKALRTLDATATAAAHSHWAAKYVALAQTYSAHKLSS